MALPPSSQTTVTPTIFTYTEDLPRPSCHDCGAPVLVPDSVDDPTTPWEGSCSGGHSATYQLEEDQGGEEDVILCVRGKLYRCYPGGVSGYAESPE